MFSTQPLTLLRCLSRVSDELLLETLILSRLLKVLGISFLLLRHQCFSLLEELLLCLLAAVLELALENLIIILGALLDG